MTVVVELCYNRWGTPDAVISITRYSAKFPRNIKLLTSTCRLIGEVIKVGLGGAVSAAIAVYLK